MLWLTCRASCRKQDGALLGALQQKQQQQQQYDKHQMSACDTAGQCAEITPFAAGRFVQMKLQRYWQAYTVVPLLPQSKQLLLLVSFQLHSRSSLPQLAAVVPFPSTYPAGFKLSRPIQAIVPAKKCVRKSAGAAICIDCCWQHVLQVFGINPIVHRHCLQVQ
jgi:hypothetical protein